MAGLDPAIQSLTFPDLRLDARIKSGHDVPGSLNAACFRISPYSQCNMEGDNPQSQF
jgi:hypothetical protein